jgi:hypothetical protein
VEKAQTLQDGFFASLRFALNDRTGGSSFASLSFESPSFWSLRAKRRAYLAAFGVSSFMPFACGFSPLHGGGKVLIGLGGLPQACDHACGTACLLLITAVVGQSPTEVMYVSGGGFACLSKSAQFRIHGGKIAPGFRCALYGYDYAYCGLAHGYMQRLGVSVWWKQASGRLPRSWSKNSDLPRNVRTEQVQSQVGRKAKRRTGAAFLCPKIKATGARYCRCRFRGIF